MCLGAGLGDIGPRGMRLVEGIGCEVGRRDKLLAVVAVGHSSCILSVVVYRISMIGLPLLLVLLVLIIRSYLLSVFEATVSGCAVLLVAGLLAAIVLLLWRVLRLLVSTLVIAALLRVRAVALRRILLLVVLLLATVLVVLIVGTGHYELFDEI
jgi:hypothetical protein